MSVATLARITEEPNRGGLWEWRAGPLVSGGPNPSIPDAFLREGGTVELRGNVGLGIFLKSSLSAQLAFYKSTACLFWVRAEHRTSNCMPITAHSR